MKTKTMNVFLNVLTPSLTLGIILSVASTQASSLYLQTDTENVQEAGATLKLGNTYFYGGADTEGWYAVGLGYELSVTDIVTFAPYYEHGRFDEGYENIVDLNFSVQVSGDLSIGATIGYKNTKLDDAFMDYMSTYKSNETNPSNPIQGEPTNPDRPEFWIPRDNISQLFTKGANTEIDTRKLSANATYKINELALTYIYTHEFNSSERDVVILGTSDTVNGEYRTNEHELILSMSTNSFLTPYAQVSHFTVNGDNSDTVGTIGLQVNF